jgi:hypothetical protein
MHTTSLPATAASPVPVVAARSKDYGYLAPVARPLEWTLRRAEAGARRYAERSSWGWAIVLTTFVVNLALLPFRILAARNAKTMKALQPQVDAINARYKRKGLNMDPEQSREIAEVYRQNRTSPLAGCIPGSRAIFCNSRSSGGSPNATRERRAREQRTLTGSSDLLSNHTPKRFFKGFTRVCDVLPQRVVNQTLVVTATCLLDLGSEPGNQIFVEPNGNPGLSLWVRHHRATFRFRKIIFALHFHPRTGGVLARSPSARR